MKRLKEQRKKLKENGIVDGKWGPWGSWSSCDSKREKKRTRKCDSPAPLYGGMYCPGDSKEEALCPGLVSSDYSGNEEQESKQEFIKRLKEQRKKLMENGIVDGKWEPWGSWSSCDSKRAKKRTRRCDSPAPLYGGMYCPGDSKEEALCPAAPGCACPYVKSPVCGSDGKTYSNGCLADCDGVAISCDRKCPCPAAVIG